MADARDTSGDEVWRELLADFAAIDAKHAPKTSEEQAVYDAQLTLSAAFAETMQVDDQMNDPRVLAAQEQLDAARQVEARSRGIRDTAA